MERIESRPRYRNFGGEKSRRGRLSVQGEGGRLSTRDAYIRRDRNKRQVGRLRKFLVVAKVRETFQLYLSFVSRN